MTTPHVPWIEALPRRPLCPVPWEGNTVVASDGQVLLCCFSDAVVGNVHKESFHDAWNGPQMQRIRRTLAAGALPPECRTGSCPIFRGDTRHYLIDRRDGAWRDGAHTTMQAIAAQRLAGSRLEVPATVRSGQALRATLQLGAIGDPERVDLFVCVRGPDGALRFLPHGDDVPMPSRSDLVLEGDTRVDAADVATDASWRPGPHELTVALFLPGSDPNLINHCYWATSARFELTA